MVSYSMSTEGGSGLLKFYYEIINSFSFAKFYIKILRY